MTATNCFVSCNQVNLSGTNPHPGGSGIFISTGFSDITNCTVVYNNRVGLSNSSGVVSAVNSIFYFNEVAQISTSVTVDYSDIEGGFPTGEGNIDVDPDFVDPPNDLRIAPSSMCIDAGTNDVPLPSTDFEGNPRVVDGDNDSTATVDMGADEYVGLTPTPDIKANGQDGPVSITLSENVNVTGSLDPASSSGVVYEWWIGAFTQFGNYWLNPSLKWVPSVNPISLGQIPLSEILDYPLLDIPLPVGFYIFFFILDANLNGILDEISWYDYVVVIVSSADLYHDMEALPDFKALFQEKIK
jgi:hypothetical protein